VTAPATETFRSEADTLWDGPGKAARAGRDIATRTSNALYRNGFHSVGSLTSKTEADLLDLRSFGVGCLGEVRRVLKAHGLHLAGEGESRARA
jgi:DNA-directed RNA polymerase alpha subunit